MFSVRWPLARRMALWVLDQALPDAPDLAALLRTVFITMAAGAAAGVALVGLFIVGLSGIYQLLLEQGLSPAISSLSVTGIALLAVFAAYRFVRTVMDDWVNRRTAVKDEADILGEIKDIATTLAFSFLDGLKEEPKAPRNGKEDIVVMAEDEGEAQVIRIKRTK